jgi:hypothetical protein
MKENEIVTTQNTSLISIEDYAMSIEGVLKQVELIQKVQKEVMKVDEHFGKIPGTQKPTLYKAGAEKLCMVFRLSQEYDFLNSIREMTFIAYTIKCSLIHIPTGQKVSTGVGSCNSREKKYRYTFKTEMTENQVPKTYWDAKKANNNPEMKRILGEGNRTIKNEETGQWMIGKSEKVENENAFDLDNTITKMACKRALVAATLNATAASDIFAQDLEDISGKVEQQANKQVIDEQQIKQVDEMMTDAGVDKAHFLNYLKVESVEKIPASMFNRVMNDLKVVLAKKEGEK